MLAIEFLDVIGHTVPVVHPEIGDALDAPLVTLVHDDLHAIPVAEFLQAVVKKVVAGPCKQVGGRLPCLGGSATGNARGIPSEKAQRDDVDPGFGVDIDRLPNQLLQLLTVELLFFRNDKSRNEQRLLIMADNQDATPTIAPACDGTGGHKNQQQNNLHQPTRTPGSRRLARDVGHTFLQSEHGSSERQNTVLK